MREPLDASFNAATMALARSLYPDGYDITATEISSLEEITEHKNRTGRLLVWSGGSETSIFASPRYNYAFRAWHDWHHVKWQLPFTPKGEATVCVYQYIDLVRFYGHDCPMLLSWRALLDAEINGQLAYCERHGVFPDDQYSFVSMYLRNKEAALTAHHMRMVA